MSKEQVGHDIEGVGEFLAKPGTAVHELAGAASYWSRRALKAEDLLIQKWRDKWNDGFLTGSIVITITIAIVFGISRLFW